MSSSLLPRAMPRRVNALGLSLGLPRKSLHTLSHNELKGKRYLDDPKKFRFEECDENLSPLKTQKKTGGRKEGRKEGRKDVRREGRAKGRKDGRT